MTRNAISVLTKNRTYPFFVRSLVGVVLAGALCAQTNTLLIIGDDMGVDTVGAYKEGNATAPTPNIDALAKQGVLFRNAYACPTCTPTRAGLMTGRYGFRTGVGKVGDLLPTSETTIPEALNTGKVAHALIGKWHLGGSRAAANHPNTSGWSHFAGAMSGGFSSRETYYSWNKVTNGTRSTSTVYATTDNVNDALSWIGKQTGTWLCSVNFNAPHTPFHTPPSTLHTYNLTGKRLPRDRLLFFKAAIEAMDTEIGRLLKGIDSKVLAKTTVIFMGDNGTGRSTTEAPFDNSRGKDSLYENGWNVPLIVSGPTVQSGGREVAALVHSVDLFSTVLELAGIDPTKAVPATTTLDSVSFAPYLSNASQPPLRQFVFTEKFDTSSHSRAIRNDRYKLIQPQGNAQELYDLLIDPFEKKDLLAGPLNQTEKENLARLQAEILRLQGQASWLAFGSGCAHSTGTPTLAAASGQTPIAGKSFTTNITGLPSSASQCVGFLGFSRSTWLGVALPFDLKAIGATGCTLYVSADFQTQLTATSGNATWSGTVPSTTSVLGVRFYQQIMVGSTINPFGAVFSNAGEGLVEAK